MRLSGWRASTCAMALGLLALAFYQGCGGDDDNGPAGPGSTTWNDAAAGALSLEAVPTLVNTASFTWAWWNANFIAPARPSEGAGADGNPATYDESQQAWLFETGPFDYSYEFSSLVVTSTVQTDYRVQYLGPDGPLQYCTDADRMTFVINRDITAEVEDSGGNVFLCTMNFVLNGNVTFNASTGLTPVYTGSGTGTVAQLSGTGSHTPVDLDPFTFSASFGAHQAGFCATGTAVIDMGQYETQIQFADQEAVWEVKLNGVPLDPPFGSTENMFYCSFR